MAKYIYWVKSSRQGNNNVPVRADSAAIDDRGALILRAITEHDGLEITEIVAGFSTWYGFIRSELKGTDED